MYHPITIGNHFIRKATKQDISLTPAKLLSLVYIAHGWHLGTAGKPLIDESVEVWKHVPVIASLYHLVKKYGRDQIKEEINIRSTDPPLSDKDKKYTSMLLDKVWEEYGSHSDIELSNIIRADNSPWHTAMKGKRDIISDEIIETHYREKVAANKREQLTHKLI